MTVINLFAKGPVGLILTDSAVYQPDGTVVGFTEKTVPIKRLRMAVVARGSLRAAPWLADEVEEHFDTFDAFVAAAGDFVRQFHDDYLHALEINGDSTADFGIVGWSQARRQCEGYFITSMDTRPLHPRGVAPFTLQRQDVFLAPHVPEDALVAAGLLQDGCLVGEGEDLLTRIIDLQRVTPVEVYGRPGVYIVGGEAVLTTIGEEGISRRGVRRWGDDVGERIRPTTRDCLPRCADAAAEWLSHKTASRGNLCVE